MAPPVERADRSRPLPMSFGQQRLWFLSQLEPGSAEYNIPMALHLAGPLDVGALGRALDEIVARHEVLRTRLVATDGVGYQIIDEPSPFPLRTADLRAEPDPLGRARELAAVDAITPFDLAAGPLLRGRLLRLGHDDHALIMVMHHVICDDWSADIFRCELSVLYLAYRAGQPSPLPSPRVQYADYSVWQRSWLTGEVLRHQLDYWTGRLADAPGLDLPTDRPRPTVRSPAGGVVPFEIPAATAERLLAQARRAGATMFMTLLSAVAVLLGRYADQDDVVLGTPAANRDRDETAELIGFFVNSLVLRVDLSANPTFAGLLSRVRKEALAAYANQDVPFERLVDTLAPRRDRGRHPIFQVMITHGRGGAAEADFAGLVAEGIELPANAATFDLTIAFTESSFGLSGDISYSAELFDRSTVKRMANHLVVLITEAATGADQQLSRMSLLTEAERERLTLRWNAAATRDQAPSLLELITASMARHPAAPAVTHNGQTLSYGQLRQRANRLARYLRQLGARPETVVGIHLDRGPDMVVAMLAVMAADAAYLPLDTGYPAERITLMLADAVAAMLICGGGTGQPPADTVGHQIQLDDPATAAAIAAQSDAPLIDRIDRPDQAAYVIYPPGSTGVPKGVAVTRHSAANLVAAQIRDRELSSGDVAMHQACVGFDLAFSEIFEPLAAGAHLIIAPRPSSLSAPEFQEFLRANAITHAHIPPALLATLDPGALPSLRVLITGGELCPPALAHAWARGRRFINGYGPTETTVCATQSIDPDTSGPLPIGRPIANTRTYVLGRSLRPAPIGVPGELYIAGEGVSRGYHGRPALTAERFLPDLIAADGSRMYRTGDRVSWRADGQLAFLGRVDQPALPAPASGYPGPAETFVAPRTEVEQILARVWAEVLGVDRVGIEDNFFELGGDSIVSIQAVARARALGVHVTPANLFDHQTIASLAPVAVGRICVGAEQGVVAGEFTLSPIQHWFFRRDLPSPAHFNQAMVLEIAEPVKPGTLRLALAALTRQHDMLRARYTRYGTEWSGRIVAAEQGELLWVVEASDISGWDEREYLDAHGGAAQSSLDLEQGPLLRCVLFNRGSGSQLLLIVVHQLAVDGVSWPILIEDLATAYDQSERGQVIRLAPKTTSFKNWSRRLTELARGAELAREARYWREAGRHASPVPRDRDGANTVASARNVRVALSAAQTSRLLREVPSAYRTQINDALLTALAITLTEWTKADRVLVDLKAHGREDLGPDIDVSRTVGWFTSFYPVVLARPAGAGQEAMGAALRQTREYLRAVPRRGLGYGLLCYLTDPRDADGADGAVGAQISFDYLGKFDEATEVTEAAEAVGRRFSPGGGSFGSPVAGSAERTHLIEVNSEIAAGELALVWTYSDQVHDVATVDRLARRYLEVLGELIEHCRSPDRRLASRCGLPIE